MITKLYLKNFKNISKEIKIKFAPITLIFGLNNVGKSSVIQSLDLIANLSNKFELPLLTKYKNYGSIENIVNKSFPKNSTSIGIDAYQRNQDNNFCYYFSKNNSKIDFFDSSLENHPELIQTIEFNNNHQAYFKSINIEKKSYHELNYLVYEVIRNPDKQFLIISSALDNLIKYKKNQFIYKEYEKRIHEKFKGEISITDYDLGDTNHWIKKIENEFLDNHDSQFSSKKSDNYIYIFTDLFSDFIYKSSLVKDYVDYILKINNLFSSEKKEDIIYALHIFLEGRVFASIFINNFDYQTLRQLNPRLQQRFNRLVSLEIDLESDLNSLTDNIKNISQFFKLSMDNDSTKKKSKAKKLLYKCITSYKLNLDEIDGLDQSLNLLKIIKDIRPTIFNNNAYSDSQDLLRRTIGERPLPFQLRSELIKFNKLSPELNIFHNQMANERVFTYQNENSYLDKLFENRSNESFLNFIKKHLITLGFNVDNVSIISDENSFRIKLGNIDLADCGTGLKNIFSIIVQLYDHTNLVNRRNRQIFDNITCIEEPEANLHPKFQAELGSLLAEFVGTHIQQRSQILIETHSQNLTLRLLKLVRNGKLSKKDIAFNCLFLDEKNEVSVFTPELLSNGSFVGSWPGGFFEESLSELYD